MYSNDYSSFIHNSQRLETTHQPVNRKTVVYLDGDILLNNKKERANDIYSNTEGTLKYVKVIRPKGLHIV